MMKAVRLRRKERERACVSECVYINVQCNIWITFPPRPIAAAYRTKEEGINEAKSNLLLLLLLWWFELGRSVGLPVWRPAGRPATMKHSSHCLTVTHVVGAALFFHFISLCRNVRGIMASEERDEWPSDRLSSNYAIKCFQRCRNGTYELLFLLLLPLPASGSNFGSLRIISSPFFLFFSFIL